MNILTGNIVAPDQCGWGSIHWDDQKITAVNITSQPQPGKNWILPGFIDLHFHGLGNGDCDTENLKSLIDFAPRTGLTTIAPTSDSETPEKTLEFVRVSRCFCRESKPGMVRYAGSHVEGPFLEYEHRGGMSELLIRNPDPEEMKRLLKEADGTLRLMTIAPELPHAPEVIQMLTAAGVQVSAGHTGMTSEDFPKAVASGVRQICHLFDAWDGRNVVGGVSQPAVTDLALIDDRLLLEVIMDGFHVPPPLVELTIRAAGARRVIAITDAMRGTGLPDGVYAMTDGREYILNNKEVCRLKDDPTSIVGSCLTMNMAYSNLVHRFHVPPVEAAWMTSGNAARSLKLAQVTGALKSGLDADIVVLASDQCTVLQTIARGVTAYEV